MTESGPNPRNTFRFLLPVGAIVGVALVALFVVKHLGSGTASRSMPPREHAQPSQPLELALGIMLPDLALTQFQGSSSSLSALGAKVALINFWATWCEACMLEMPSIVQLYQGYHDRGLAVIAVNLDTEPDRVLPTTIKRYKMGFPVYTDLDSKLTDLFRVEAIPLTIVVDRNRRVLMIENEGLDWNGAEFRAQLEKWLAG